MQTGDWAQAELRYLEMIELRPPTQEETAAIANRVVTAIQAQPQAVEPQLLFARVLHRAGDSATALENLRKLTERHPDDARVPALVAELGAQP